MPFTVATFNVLDRMEPSQLMLELQGGDGSLGEEAQRAAAMAAERLYRAKITATAGAVRRLDADVIAFQEVQSTRVLDDIRAALPARDGVATGGYVASLCGPHDRRGIACGVLTRLPVQNVIHHTEANLPFPVFVEGDPQPFAGRLATRRGVLEVVLTLADDTALHVLVVHFKSKLPSEVQRADGSKVAIVTMRDFVEAQVRAEIARLSEALHLRAVIDRRLDENPRVQMLVAGDMNDTPESLTVRVVRGDGVLALRSAYLQVLSDRAMPLAGRALHSCLDGFDVARRKTIEWHGIPENIDHLLVSDAMWERFHSVAVHNERLSEFSAALGPVDNGALVSDHSPIVARFV
jgi:endonuclease/exonuclease/phosphatase family metal-dependent hydrolase